jgi:HK97 gp10 family phage protein
MASRIGITGLKETIDKLRAFGPEAKVLVKAIAQSTADLIVLEAKKNAPKDTGKLAQSIGKESKNGGATVVVFVGMTHGVFVEFGTGTYVSVPAELKDEALQFKGFKNGNFDEFLLNITEWCKRKGIEETAAYPIAMSILKKGIKPQPYFYPAYLKGKASIQPKLEAAVRRLERNFNNRR